MSATLEERIWRLEQIEAIRMLKARYWRACDSKDVEAVRDCYAEGPIEVDFDGTGKHTNRDAFYELFEKFSLRDYIVEHHHGGASSIEIVSSTSARATWSLHYRLMNTKTKTLFVVGGYYDDLYELEDGEWRVRKSSFRVVSSFGQTWDDAGLRVVEAGARVQSEPVEQS